MNIKIIYHIMPWEIDYTLLTFTQLKKSKYHLPDDVKITIDSVLNLSSYIINWEESKLPKEFFINKYNHLSILLKDYTHNSKIYDENQIYGHLELQKECVSSEIDHYITVSPDMYFSEYLLSYLIESVRHIHNKYFVVTPQISKLWDHTWDEITNPKYHHIPYTQWDSVDIFNIQNDSKTSTQEHLLSHVNKNKWAGWFDLFSKSFYEELCPIQDDWTGYGPWDWYSMMLAEYAKEKEVDFQQYLLQGETIFEYSVGPLKNGGFSKYYKDLLYLNDIPNQRQQFESKMQEYLQRGIQQLKTKNIL
jgi:hypothetical protein